MRIYSFYHELRLRATHVGIYSVLTLSIIIKYTPTYLVYLLLPIVEYFPTLIIQTTLTSLFFSQITCGTLIYLTALIYFSLGSIFLFTYPSYLAKEQKKKKKQLAKILIYWLGLSNTLTHYFVPMCIYFFLQPYQTVAFLNLQTFITMHQTLKYYSTSFIMLFFGILLLTTNSHWNRYRKFFYTFVSIGICLFLPPNILLHCFMVIHLILIGELFVLINKYSLKKWKRLDSNQRSIIQ